MIDGQAPVETFDEIDSTLLEARRRAERGELSPVWLVAKAQTAGRGRRGRAWSSIEGNLLATFLAAADRPPSELALLGFAIGVAVAETLEHYAGPGRATLKWPNDVLFDGAKASGILIDSGAGPAGAWAALAFGVNIADAPQGLDQAATCLRQVLPPDAPTPSAVAFLAQMRPTLERLDGQLKTHGFGPLREAWLLRAHGLGQMARVAQGAAVLEGRIAGLSERGELEFDTAEGRRLISAGDVYFTNNG